MYMRKVFVLKMLLAEFLVINMRSYLVFIAQLIMMMYQNIEMLQGKNIITTMVTLRAVMVNHPYW